MTVSSWHQSEDWDVLGLGGQSMPGIARVEVRLGSGLDVKKPKGARCATIKDQGTPPATLSITLELQHDEMALFEVVLKLLRPRSINGARDPLEITHPQAALWGISAVTIGEITSPMPTRGGTYIVSIEAIEWAPAPVKTKKSKTSPVGDHGRSAQELIDEQNLRPPSDLQTVLANFSSPDQTESIDPSAL